MPPMRPPRVGLAIPSRSGKFRVVWRGSAWPLDRNYPRTARRDCVCSLSAARNRGTPGQKASEEGGGGEQCAGELWRESERLSRET